MENVIRTETHEVDTAARAIIPTLLPMSWECREVGGRDYGIDLQLERFETGRATGNMLLLQIKGTRKELDETDLHFDLPVQTLKYAEMFVVPFLLVVCPVNATPRVAYFCWLQEHIRILLDFENPTWRTNVSTVRIHLNRETQIPACSTLLDSIAQEPQRLRDWLKVATMLNNFKYLLPRLEIQEDYPISDEDLIAGKAFVENLRALKSLYSHPTGHLITHYSDLLNKTLDLIRSEGPYKLEDLAFSGAVKNLPPGLEQYRTEDDVARMLLSLNLHTATNGLMTTLSQYFEDGFAYAMLATNTTSRDVPTAQSS